MVGHTPLCHFDDRHFQSVIEARLGPAVDRGYTLAFSVKTNPTAIALRVAREAGLLAEAINVAEVEAAASAGWEPSQMILNGPGKRWPTGALPAGLLAVNCDTVDEFRQSLCEPVDASFLGLRLLPPAVESRFGVDLTAEDSFGLAVAALAEAARKGRPVALHAHFNSVERGVEDWWVRMRALLPYASTLAERSGATIGCVDLGGGWDRQGLDSVVFGDLGLQIMRALHQRFAECSLVILEPGHSLVAAAGVVYTRVLSRRPGGVVVDASVGELPFPVQRTRPVYHLSDRSNWERLSPGEGSISGRTCMETDVLAVFLDVARLDVGEVLALCDAGSYDTSMRFGFATGTRSESP